MKKYSKAEVEIIELSSKDIVTESDDRIIGDFPD